MHPAVSRSRGSGTCPICGMDLVPVTKEQQEQGVVTIDETRRQLIGVRTAPVVEAPMRWTFRAVGLVAYDESALSDVEPERSVAGSRSSSSARPDSASRAARRSFCSTAPSSTTPSKTSSSRRGAPRRRRLGSTRRTEAAWTRSGSAARERLHLLGLDGAQIDELARKGTPSESVAFRAPASGFVIEKNVVQGGSVDPGTRLYRIAALGNVWIEADVYEADVAHVRAGQHAAITLDYLPGRSYSGKVAYVYPALDPTTRTGRVRVELPNKGLDLRPGMFANVELAEDVGRRVQVPAPAVVYTGPRRLVFVDLGQGRFAPREVHVGSASNGMVEVLDGLSAGDVVATSGVFLIAAEARISTAAKYWEPMTEAGAPHERAPRKAIRRASAS